MLLFPGQAVHCHLFMSFFFALPSLFLFSPNSKYGNCVCQFVFIHTHSHMHIYTCGFVQTSFNVCLLYCAECKLVLCSCVDAMGVAGSCGSCRENFSILRQWRHSLMYPQSIICLHTLVCVVYSHYYSELPLSLWMRGGTHRLRCSHSRSTLRLKREEIFHSQLFSLFI